MFMKMQYKVNRAMVPNTLIKKWFTYPSLWYAILIGGKNQVHNRRRVLSEVSQLRNHLGFTELLTKSRLVLVRGILRVSRLKSPVINASFILLSKARPIKFTIEDKVWAGEFDGL